MWLSNEYFKYFTDNMSRLVCDIQHWKLLEVGEYIIHYIC